MEGNSGGNRIVTWRMWLLSAVVPVLLAIFIVRLYQLQIFEGAYYAERAVSNRLRRVSLPAPRGVMYDRNGVLLASNVPSFNIMITPALLPDSEAEVDAIYRRLSALTGVPIDLEGETARPCAPGRGIVQLVEEGLTNRPYDPWPIACDVDEQTARILREEQIDLPGVSVLAVPIRDYTTGVLTAAVIGYLGPIPEAFEDYYRGLGFEPSRDRVGYGGIELYFQEILAGTNGSEQVEVDVAGQQLREVGPITAPIPGNSLRLSIDTRLQAAAETALLNRMAWLDRYAPADQRRTSIGVVIAMNPQTGEILAMVSVPSYENNRLARLIPEDYSLQLESDPAHPWINHAITSLFAPGSTFK